MRHALINTVNVEDLCNAVPCGTMDCWQCPLESTQALNEFLRENTDE
ncbi:hypothetical protein BN110_030 [Yersinia phage phiR8-01]|uniref:Uncharacterized protein n=1 Tax=Yersinia phage phiR8-01 TaxID=1206556 RepID=I7K2I1_9CAUD|nr:hypothetical protein HOT05_gp20 [Yersinia phage phiR8-01]CCI88401.2 hypothetical protein BN110_030 [Yersinia phage phiR8-01]